MDIERKTFEVPLWRGNHSAFVEVACHQEKLLLVTIEIDGRREALFYNEMAIHGPDDMEHACRVALGQLRLIAVPSDRNRRQPLVLDLHAEPYDSVLFAIAS